jgi:hypothetical protein
MGRWTDIATWIGPTVNSGDGDGRPGEPEDRIGTVYGLVLHIQEGTEAGTEAWQRNPAAQVSSHFLLPKQGRPRQMVDTAERSWCQSAGNSHWLSLECEGHQGDALTPDQVAGAAALVARANRELGVPLQVVDKPLTVTGLAGGGLTFHGAGGAAWGGHYQCPGGPIAGARALILTAARDVLSPSVNVESKEDDQVLIMQSHQIKPGPGTDQTNVTLVGLRMDGALAKAAGVAAHASFKADFGKAKLRWAAHSATSPAWSWGEVLVDSAKPAAAASIPLPADCDGISVYREPLDAGDHCTTPVALILEIG